MELLTPGTSLMVWQLFWLVTILLVLVSWVLILTTRKIEPTRKLIWLLATFFLPVVGPILLFFSLPALKRTN